MSTNESVLQNAQNGDRLAILRAMRDKLAQDFDSADTPPAVRVAISKQMQSILDQIEDLTDDVQASTPLELLLLDEETG
jgi:hypothetical protein